MKIYVDTSIIGGYFDDKNKSHSNIREIFHQEYLEFYGSTISILEFESILARKYNQFQFNANLDLMNELNSLSQNERIQILTQWCLKKLKIQIFSGIAIEKMMFNNEEISIENVYNLAWKLNSILKLRTLDAIQICSAVQFRVFDGIEIQYFLTNDQNIIEQKDQIYQRSRILPISSKNLIDLIKYQKITKNKVKK